MSLSDRSPAPSEPKTQTTPLKPPRAPLTRKARSSRPAPFCALDPRVKICLIVACMALGFCVNTPLQAALATAFLCLFVGLSRLNLVRFVLSTLPVIAPLLFVTTLNLWITRTGSIVWAWGVFSVTSDGLAAALLYGGRVSLIVGYGALLLATTAPNRLTDAFASLLAPLRVVHAPVKELAFVLSLALLFAPTLADEFEAIREAQASRGGAIAKGTVVGRFRALLSLVVPVLVAALRHAEGLSLALDSRAWESGGTRTQWHPFKIRASDLSFVALGIVYGALLLFAGRLE